MNATVEELRAALEQIRAALEQIRQDAEQYLDTEHRSDPRDAELRRNLSEAALHASLVLYPPSAADIVKLVTDAAGADHLTRERIVNSGRAATHSFAAGGDDSAFGPAGTWCAVWVERSGEKDQCGLPQHQHRTDTGSSS